MLKEALKHNATIHSWSLGFTLRPFFFLVKILPFLAINLGIFPSANQQYFLQKYPK
jgi:hypothetical protein